ncbi:MAG TPA: tetratricopeptide repeat protein [Bryobacteraceae bacterium]|nr:tetratricopeptide repeat protein [Bryobacteraceae bacterium]
MVQPATIASVKGDFTRGALQLHGANYRVRQIKGAYFITESDLTGNAQEYRIDYTLGNRRVQHYLATLPSGRVVVLAPSWDVLRKQWFHNLEIADPYQSSESNTVQVWNKSCYSCHVSQQEKNFDVENNVYKNTWLDFGTNCERCHGPGSDHAARYALGGPAAGSPAIVLQTRLDAKRNTMVCAQCHSFRDIYVNGYMAGADYYDYFLPILEFDQPADRDPAYWPDGRTRRFSNDAFGFWQSECYLKGGATCLDCHTKPHETEIERNPQLRPDANALCTRCHTALAENLTGHTHHLESSAGSSCVECHMPRTVVSIKAAIRDHSMSGPVPENTIRHSIPNACNQCHKDHDAAWALDRMNRWYPAAASRRKWISRADAFTQARAMDPHAIPLLLAILGEPSAGPLARANAAGYLGSFSFDPAALAALKRALTDPEPVVRAIAALYINPGPADKAEAIDALRHSLSDSAATVRIAAMVSLVSHGVHQLPGEDGRRFDQAKQLFAARAELNSDDAEQDLAAGKFFYLTGDTAKAIRALRTSLMLDPSTPARYLLALAYVQQQNIVEARSLLQSIVPSDSQYARAQKLLMALAGK